MRARSPKFQQVDEAKIMHYLEIFRAAAMEAGAFAPALRAIELMGRHIGMWRGESNRQVSLADLIAEAGAGADGSREDEQ